MPGSFLGSGLDAAAVRRVSGRKTEKGCTAVCPPCPSQAFWWQPQQEVLDSDSHPVGGRDAGPARPDRRALHRHLGDGGLRRQALATVALGPVGKLSVGELNGQQQGVEDVGGERRTAVGERCGEDLDVAAVQRPQPDV
jgi:hypothetical protein